MMNKLCTLKTFFYSCLFLAHIISIPSYSGITCLDTDQVKKLKLLTQSRTMMRNGSETKQLYPPVSDATQEMFVWRQIFADIVQNKILAKSIFSSSQPAKFSSPQLVTLYEEEKVTTIDHKQKRISVQRIDANQLDRISLVFAGRLYKNKIVSDLIQNASREGHMIQQDGTKMFDTQLPGVSATVTLFLNKKLQLTKIKENNRIITYDWKETGVDNFAYVHHSSTVISQSGKKFYIEEWVRNIVINPPFASNLFKIQYPENYEMKDMRKLLTPPKF